MTLLLLLALAPSAPLCECVYTDPLAAVPNSCVCVGQCVCGVPPKFVVANKCTPAPSFAVTNRCAAPGVAKATPRPFPQSPTTRATSAASVGQVNTSSPVPDPFRGAMFTSVPNAVQYGGTSSCANGQCGTTQTFFPRRR